MLKLFEDITEDLTDYENQVVKPIIIQGLELKRGKENAVTNKHIVEKLKEQGIKTSTPRVRKIIHDIRVNDTIPCLIATSSGYYISKDIEELDNYILSLTQRMFSIKEIRDSLRKQRDLLKCSK